MPIRTFTFDAEQLEHLWILCLQHNKGTMTLKKTCDGQACTHSLTSVTPSISCSTSPHDTPPTEQSTVRSPTHREQLYVHILVRVRISSSLSFGFKFLANKDIFTHGNDYVSHGSPAAAAVVMWARNFLVAARARLLAPAHTGAVSTTVGSTGA